MFSAVGSSGFFQHFHMQFPCVLHASPVLLDVIILTLYGEGAYEAIVFAVLFACYALHFC
jgi:hypothetical protein